MVGCPVIGLDGTFALDFTVSDPVARAIRACEVLVNGKIAQRAFTVSQRPFASGVRSARRAVGTPGRA
jgi:hypothetical protein